MRVLVTGGAGFIGSHVVDVLRSKGHTVRIFDMTYPTFRQDIEFYHGSILDWEQVYVSMAQVDAVIHLGAVANVNDVVEDPLRSEAINVRGTMHVLDACRRARIKRLVYISTVWVYQATGQDPVDENTPLSAPPHLYTATKLVGEYYCRCYHGLYKLPYTILRYGIPYGPRARGATVVSLFVDKAARGEPLTVAGEGKQYRRFVYVTDMAEATVLALDPKAENQTYNVEGDEKVTIIDLAEQVKKLVNPSIEIKRIPERAGDFSGKTISNEKIKKELGWKPKVNFAQGLKEFVKWYKEQRSNS